PCPNRHTGTGGRSEPRPPGRRARGSPLGPPGKIIRKRWVARARVTRVRDMRRRACAPNPTTPRRNAEDEPMTAATAATTAPRRKGPQTPEAKERVRQNALKHGLRAEVLVAEEDREAISRKIETWTEELAPVGDVERTLVQRAAAA